MTIPTTPESMPESVPTSMPDAVENVRRGLLFSAGSIVVAIVGYGILSGVIGIFGYVTGIVAIAIPLVGAWLYTKGAGTAVKAGRLPWIGVQAVAIIVGALTVVVASAWYGFSRVGGDGGIFSSAFWRTVANSAGREDVIIPVVITLAAGGFGIYAALRQKKVVAPAAPVASPFGSTAPAFPVDATAPVAGSVAPPAPGTPITPPPAATSPGVVLNGEPVDPDKK